MEDGGLLVFLLCAGFLAAFVDAVVGGGGLITVPALMMTGMLPVAVLGTNKAASVMGAFASVLSFMRSGKVDFRVMKYLFPLSLFGSCAGVYTVRLVPPDFLKPFVVVMLVAVTVYSLTKKEWGDKARTGSVASREIALAMPVIFALGFYDGFFGPGTGSFMLFAFLCMGKDFVGAAANARAANFASNLSAAALFAYLGDVNFAIALPMGCAMIAGAYLGTRMAILKGAKYVRPLFISVTALLIGKQVWDMLR